MRKGGKTLLKTKGMFGLVTTCTIVVAQLAFYYGNNKRAVWLVAVLYIEYVYYSV